MVDALHVDTGLLLAAGDDFAEDVRVVHQFALQNRRDLVTLRHHVIGQHAVAPGHRERLLERREVFVADDPRFVRENVQAGIDGGTNVVDLAAVAPGEHHDVPRTVGKHPREKIGRCVDVEFP